MVTGESVLRGMSDRRLQELLACWAHEMDVAQTADERRICARMMAKYQGEIERREYNGSGEGD